MKAGTGESLACRSEVQSGRNPLLTRIDRALALDKRVKGVGNVAKLLIALARCEVFVKRMGAHEDKWDRDMG